MSQTNLQLEDLHDDARRYYHAIIRGLAGSKIPYEQRPQVAMAKVRSWLDNKARRAVEDKRQMRLF